MGVGIDSTTVSTYDVSPKRYIDFVNEFGKTNVTLPMTFGWGVDGKDSYIFPTSGTVQRAGIEITAPGSDLKYYRATYQLQQFFPLSKELTLLLNGEIGVANGYGGMNLPFYKNFYAGGISSVRGYSSASLGPRDIVCENYSTQTNCIQSADRLGGNRRIVANAEILWGVPGMEKALRLGPFFDVGQVFAKGAPIRASDFRSSVGISAAWISPMGPLKFAIAQPLNKKEGDQPERFQFQMGTTF